MKKTSDVVVEVTFKEYETERLSGAWPEAVTPEEVLMDMFEKRGILMAAENKPKQPVSIFTDKDNRKFVITQTQ
ncbi:hypothetical protein GN109_05765 [Collimonas pratensis]|uniref:hypothetical protein n=1 Tax=Collimonas pratensis TaxID=279113 RepID=UPI00143D9E5E|nr:hypothetical protein [Collimonas pratensis]NKI68921.1 hypothetical protein [Collimonas pratensis]